MKKIKVIILAAGASKRLGKPKQLLKFEGKTLLQHTIDQMCAFEKQDIFVALGANADLILKNSSNQLPNVTINPSWELGMGNSIAHTTKFVLENNSDVEAILITTCDLPFVVEGDYLELCNLFTSDSDIVATNANFVNCPPVLFGKDYFDELLSLDGAKGAKRILNKYTELIKVFHNDRAAIDIDNEEAASQYCD